MPLTLHIFEERYKQMIQECIENEEPFGVVLLRSGSEVLGLGASAEPYDIGCTAQLAQVQPAGQGRMNIVALGQERFRIVELEHDHPYLVGQVEPYPLQNSDADQLQYAGAHLQIQVMRYLSMLEAMEDVQLEDVHLPDDPVSLAYFAGFLMKVQPPEKQAILTAERALDLVTKVNALYRKEIPLQEMIFRQMKRQSAAPFSLN
jgi:Lon protease-like protein